MKEIVKLSFLAVLLSACGGGTVDKDDGGSGGSRLGAQFVSTLADDINAEDGSEDPKKRLLENAADYLKTAAIQLSKTSDVKADASSPSQQSSLSAMMDEADPVCNSYLPAGEDANPDNWQLVPGQDLSEKQSEYLQCLAFYAYFQSSVADNFVLPGDYTSEIGAECQDFKPDNREADPVSWDILQGTLSESNFNHAEKIYYGCIVYTLDPPDDSVGENGDGGDGGVYHDEIPYTDAQATACAASLPSGITEPNPNEWDEDRFYNPEVNDYLICLTEGGGFDESGGFHVYTDALGEACSTDLPAGAAADPKDWDWDKINEPSTEQQSYLDCLDDTAESQMGKKMTDFFYHHLGLNENEQNAFDSCISKKESEQMDCLLDQGLSQDRVNDIGGKLEDPAFMTELMIESCYTLFTSQQQAERATCLKDAEESEPLLFDETASDEAQRRIGDADFYDCAIDLDEPIFACMEDSMYAYDEGWHPSLMTGDDDFNPFAEECTPSTDAQGFFFLDCTAVDLGTDSDGYEMDAKGQFGQEYDMPILDDEAAILSELGFSEANNPFAEDDDHWLAMYEDFDSHWDLEMGMMRAESMSMDFDQGSTRRSDTVKDGSSEVMEMQYFGTVETTVYWEILNGIDKQSFDKDGLADILKASPVTKKRSLKKGGRVEILDKKKGMHMEYALDEAEVTEEAGLERAESEVLFLPHEGENLDRGQKDYNKDLKELFVDKNGKQAFEHTLWQHDADNDLYTTVLRDANGVCVVIKESMESGALAKETDVTSGTQCPQPPQ